jgi:uncharacterized paraquat-inducible protein A
MIKCPQCGSHKRGDEFADGTGYECPRCFSNVFTDEGSASLLLLAGMVPALLVVVFLAHLLGAMSAAVSA